MKNIIFKKRWKNNQVNTFTEFGFDKDNNKFLIGVSSEIEKDDGTEIRQHGFIKMKVKEIYLRLWVFNFCFSLGTGELEIVKKDRLNFKVIFGLAGKN